jgi:hypothetical protein
VFASSPTRQIYTSDMNDEPMHMNPVQRRKAIETKEIGIPRKGTDDSDGVDEKKGVPASQGKRKITAEGLHIRGLGESSDMGAVVEGQEHSGMTLLRTRSTLRGTARRGFIGFWNPVVTPRILQLNFFSFLYSPKFGRYLFLFFFPSLNLDLFQSSKRDSVWNSRVRKNPKYFMLFDAPCRTLHFF